MRRRRKHSTFLLDGNRRVSTFTFDCAPSEGPEFLFSADPAQAETVEAESAEAAESKPKLPAVKMLAYSGGPVNVGFGMPVVIDLNGIENNATIPFLLDHNHTQIVGQGNEITINRSGVRVNGIITGQDEHSTKVVSHAKNGFQWGASVGMGITRPVEYVDAGETTQVNGRNIKGPVAVVRGSRLQEVSFVAVGADPRAGAKVAASAARNETMNFKQWLEARGLAEAELSEVSRKALLADFNASAADDDDDDGLEAVAAGGRTKRRTADNEDVLRPYKEERERCAKIRATAKRICDTNPNALSFVDRQLSLALEDPAVDPTSFELTLLRQMPVVALGGGIVQAEDKVEDEVIEAALCMRAGTQELEKFYPERTLEAARRQFRDGLGLQELLFMFANRAGYRSRSYRITSGNVKDLLRAAFGAPSQIQATGWSTNNIGNILGAVANKHAERSFLAVDRAWEKVCSIMSVNNFHTHTGVSLGGDLAYRKIPKGGDIQHGTLGETVYSIKAEMFGRMMGIPHEDLVNDDLSSLVKVPELLGRGGALALNRVFWTEWLENAGNFYSTGRLNLDTGADTAFSLSSLELAELLFLEQVDPDGHPFGISPKILVVPPALLNKARIAVGSNEVRTIMDDDESSGVGRYGTTNPYTGMFGLVSSPSLQNTAIGGNKTAWWLIADPMEAAVIEVAFLNGQRAPRVESADADFNTLGIQMRGTHAFGVAKKEYRAGVKMAGA